MLELNNIVKKYSSGGGEVTALRGVSLKFRKNEFVSILGPSGCGKTTMLNIIGGLDRYTEGDLIINGVSTKEFKDRDWDTYRNHSIGFVFQSYNLIPHQSVLSNVELALTLSGVSKSERRLRAKEALEKVGLGDQLHKKPSQMSGGQMQRVAIARALVNNPEILLADEPTGALDTATSVQIMELLKEVAADRLVIMVTHNPELAAEYSTRIVRLSDGEVIDDTQPYEGDPLPENGAAELQKKPRRDRSKGRKAKTSMSFLTAISLSTKNLLTKKGRTLMTSFAGSIGIIGIALILAVSTGVTGFINDVQRDTLSSFPISIYSEEADLSSMMSTMMEHTGSAGGVDHSNDAVYSNPILFDLIHSMTSAEVKKNNLKPFKEWVDDRNDHELGEHVSGVHYTYNIDLNMYVQDPEGNYTKADINELFSGKMGGMPMGGASMGGLDVWSEMIPGDPVDEGEERELISGLIYDQYVLVDGQWPSSANEVVLVLNENNEISDLVLYTLGFVTKDEMLDTMMAAMRGDDDYVSEAKRIEYSDIVGKKYKLVLNDAYYSYNEKTGLWESASEKVLESNIREGYDVTVSGIIKPDPDATGGIITGSLAYTSALTEYVIEESLKTKLAEAQLALENANFDIFTGLPFHKAGSENMTDAEKLAELREYLAKASASDRAALYLSIKTTPSDEYVSGTLTAYKNEMFKDTNGDGTVSSAEKREQVSALFSQQEDLGGLSAENIEKLISSYSDEELDKMIDDYLTEMIVTTYRETETAKIRAEASAPSAEKLAEIKVMVESGILVEANKNLPDGFKLTELSHQMKLMYVANIYAERTGIDSMTVMGALSSETAEQIQTRYDELLTETALEFYEANAKPTEEQINANIAAMMDAYAAAATDAELLVVYSDHMPDGLSPNSYSDNLSRIGICDISTPEAVHIYASTFEAKDEIASLIDGYNEGKSDADKISFTDYVAMLMSSVTTIINAISYVLIAFVAISLVVSSVMIGIITNISVLERTKEIGILRAIGASKRDISRVFNAETFIIGLAAGLFGIVSTIILCFPINAIIRTLTGLTNITASLPALAAVILVFISMALTMIAGLIPARSASKKDPVEALRSE